MSSPSSRRLVRVRIGRRLVDALKPHGGSRSGLNKHTTKVHGRRYESHENLYVPIPPEELAAARAKVKDGQRHRHH